MDVGGIYRDRLSESWRHLRDRSTATAFQLSTWVIVGNAAAIAFMLSAATDGRLPPTFPIKIGYAIFLVGLVSAFWGLGWSTMAMSNFTAELAEVITRMTNHQHRAFLIAELEAANAEVPVEWEAMNKADEQVFTDTAAWGERMKRSMLPPRVLAVLSILALLSGMSLPLFYL